METIATPYLEEAHGADVAAMSLPEAVAHISGADVDAVAFWDGLERSLARGDFTILVVVDEPHQQLRRSVTYVNSHADFELCLVEVDFYRSDDGTREVLAPRILDTAAKTTRTGTDRANDSHRISTRSLINRELATPTTMTR